MEQTLIILDGEKNIHEIIEASHYHFIGEGQWHFTEAYERGFTCHLINGDLDGGDVKAFFDRL